MCTREERKNKDVACLDFTLKAKLASLLPPSSSFLQKTAGAKHRSCLRQKEMLCVTEGPDLRGKNPDPKRSLWNFFFLVLQSWCYSRLAGLSASPESDTERGLG